MNGWQLSAIITYLSGFNVNTYPRLRTTANSRAAFSLKMPTRPRRYLLFSSSEPAEKRQRLVQSREQFHRSHDQSDRPCCFGNTPCTRCAADRLSATCGLRRQARRKHQSMIDVECWNSGRNSTICLTTLNSATRMATSPTGWHRAEPFGEILKRAEKVLRVIQFGLKILF